MTICSGCENQGKTPHGIECLYGHFMSYTGYWRESDEVQVKIKKAYYDGCESQGGWNPIVSAPLDGSLVDLYCVFETRTGVHGCRLTDCQFKDGAWHSEQLDNSGGYGEMEMMPLREWMKPTHWMPLPRKPLDEAA